jgi:hypothetical protein
MPCVGTERPIPCPKIPTKCVSFINSLFNDADYPVISFDWLENHEQAQSGQQKNRVLPNMSEALPRAPACSLPSVQRNRHYRISSQRTGHLTADGDYMLL